MIAYLNFKADCANLLQTQKEPSKSVIQTKMNGIQQLSLANMELLNKNGAKSSCITTDTKTTQVKLPCMLWRQLTWSRHTEDTITFSLCSPTKCHFTHTHHTEPANMGCTHVQKYLEKSQSTTIIVELIFKKIIREYLTSGVIRRDWPQQRSWVLRPRAPAPHGGLHLESGTGNAQVPVWLRVESGLRAGKQGG